MKVPYTKSGKCGNVVWQRNRYGQICYAAFVPYNPRSPAQTTVRGHFRAVSSRWRTLTQVQRDEWIAVAWTKWSRPCLGNGRLTSFNFFVKVNVALVNRGQAQIDLPPGYPQLVPKNVVRPGSTASLTSPGINGTRRNVSLPSRKAGSETGRALLRYCICTGVAPEQHAGRPLDPPAPPKPAPLPLPVRPATLPGCSRPPFNPVSLPVRGPGVVVARSPSGLVFK